METTTSNPPPPSPDSSPATQQARLRRDRREAKIKAGGSARLDKITQLSGRPADPRNPPPSLSLHLTIPLNADYGAPPTAPPLTSAFAPPDDPAEVDISQHAYASSGPGPGRFDDEAAEMRRMLRSGGGEGGMGGFSQPGMGAGPGPGSGSGGEEDPMMRMLQQMMGGMAPGGGGEAGAEQGGLPPGLAALLGGGGGVGAPQQAQTGKNWWKVGHAVLALALGVYITSRTSFSGSRVARAAVDGAEGVRGLFWVFATAEAVLQSTRFFVEKGRVRGGEGGVLGVVMGVLPEPWKGYVALGKRYGRIWTTVVEDAMVVVFLLGVKAWWMGGAVG